MTTMRYKTGEIRHYNFTAQDKLFLDANIWLYLYGPPKPRSYWRPIYTSVFSRMVRAKSRIYIDVLVVSEFINAYARMQQKIVAPHINTFKNFRSSPYFKPVAEDIAEDVESVLSHCSKTESGFTALPMDDLIADYISGNFDFNDQVITEICKNNGFTLITNDSDFKTQDIPILTANSNLL
ncbi:PIN domain-containing protein [Candidatus Poribacteria bacterium]|nr:MAG: PIN domain-containing protein [Candidatus Poribacteria bacterium]